jgi:hypothetical protein
MAFMVKSFLLRVSPPANVSNRCWWRGLETLRCQEEQFRADFLGLSPYPSHPRHVCIFLRKNVVAGIRFLSNFMVSSHAHFMLLFAEIVKRGSDMRMIITALTAIILAGCANPSANLPPKPQPAMGSNWGDIKNWCVYEANRGRSDSTIYGDAYRKGFIDQCMLKYGAIPVVIQ